MRNIKFYIILILGLVYYDASAQRITGYFPNYNYTASNYLNIQWAKMTHLYYFSLNPTRTPVAGQSDGSLWFNDPYSWFTTTYFNNVINQARAVNPNIKIIIVTGGAPGGDSDLNTRLNYISSNAGRRNTFCNNIINFIKTNDLDGWDLDWEFPTDATSRNNQEVLLSTMRQKIDSMMAEDCKHYEISIAVGGGYTDRSSHTCWNPAHTDYVNANVINYVDFVNIMTYDGNIGSPPCSFSSHQHYDLVVKALGDWMADFPTWPASKFQIGVGFYNNAHTAFNSGGNNSTYYNQTYWGTGGSGCPNMQSKINFARTQGTAGIFIWEITQDNLCAGTVPACYSLLDCIYQHTISTWGVWSAPGNPCGLPVVLTDFFGKNNGDVVTIQWTTSEEFDHDYFILQESDDGVNFTDVAQLVSGHGSERGSSYHYVDQTGSAYYRLSIVSVSGVQEWSDVIRVDQEMSSSIQAFPNPFQKTITIYISGTGPSDMSVYNTKGQIIFSIKDFSKEELGLGEDWPSGIYFLKRVSGTKCDILKLIKD